MRVREATPQDLALWQQFVDHRPDAGGMHHAAWYSVLRDAYWVTPHFLMATDPEDKGSGILSLYHSRSPLTGSYLSSLEDGVLASRPGAVSPLLSGARALRDRLRVKYRQIRGGAIDEPASITAPTVRTFVSTGAPADELWPAIKKKTRWAVRQAEKHDIVVEQDPELHDLEAFYRVYA